MAGTEIAAKWIRSMLAQTLEIVPYETEYVRDFNTDEDIEKIENARVDEIRKSIFGKNAGEDDDEWD